MSISIRNSAAVVGVGSTPYYRRRESWRVAPETPAALARLDPDPWTEPFRRAACEHRLVAPRCKQCGALRVPADHASA